MEKVAHSESSATRHSARVTRPYNGTWGRYVGDGHIDYNRRACAVCYQQMGDSHTEGCPESHRDLNAERQFKEFSLAEYFIIEELTGVPYRGWGWGGYGEPVTDDEVLASAPDQRRQRYLPPPTRTLQEAIDLVAQHFSEETTAHSSGEVRTWAIEHGFKLAKRGRIPAEVTEKYQQQFQNG